MLNYHPDIKGGSNDILAIMFDMNKLWESFIYWSLRRAASKGESVSAHQSKAFWEPKDGYARSIKPDLVVKLSTGRQVVIDTKWKYKSKVSLEDLRQVYAHLHYFQSNEGYLLYPDKLGDEIFVKIDEGNYWDQDIEAVSNQKCGLMFADLIKDKHLNKDIGTDILKILQVG